MLFRLRPDRPILDILDPVLGTDRVGLSVSSFTMVNMSYAAELVVEFDSGLRIAHLSAARVLSINTAEQLAELCRAVQARLEELGPERVYLIVDISRFAIDPLLSSVYSEKISYISERFVYPAGIVRYGYQITRVTVRMARHNGVPLDANLFSTREEAYNFVHGLAGGVKANGSGNHRTPP